jgi:prepilin signal peptidase PulO-like enzyme (type II secretory pathway)
MPVFFYGGFLAVSAYCAYADLRRGAVSRALLWGAIGAALVGRARMGGLAPALGGCLLGLGVFGLAYLCGGRRLGPADVWYAGLMGTALDIPRWYAAVALACPGAGAALVIRAARGDALHPRRVTGSIPFLPFLSAATCAALPFTAPL